MIDMCFFPIYGNMGKDSSGRTAMGYIVIARPGSHIFHVAIMHWLRCPLAVKHSTSSLDRFQEIDVLPIGNINMSKSAFSNSSCGAVSRLFAKAAASVPTGRTGSGVSDGLGNIVTFTSTRNRKQMTTASRPALRVPVGDFWRFWDLKKRLFRMEMTRKNTGSVKSMTWQIS